MSNKPYFPLFVDLSDKKIVVVGGGRVATSRVSTLLGFAKHVTVVAPQITREIEDLALRGYVILNQRSVRRSDFELAYMVLAATNDRKLNDSIYRICREEGIYVNVADNEEESDFYFPGIARSGDMVAGISASGRHAKMASLLREQVQILLTNLTD